MKEFERYMPSTEEIEKAERGMSEKEKKLSQIREENWEQEQAPWDKGEEKFDENRERRSPSKKEVEEMKLQLEELGKLFSETSLKWQIDGAINISLMRGEFIGIHKDIDISVEKKELDKMEGYLEKKGYAFFQSILDEQSNEIILRRVSYRDLSSDITGHCRIIAIDQTGKIQDSKLNFLDLHIIERNKAGLPINRSGVALPKKWFEPIPMKYQSEIINLSQPASIAYYKLQQWREYDLSDLRFLAETGRLTLRDIDEIENIIEKNNKNNEKKMSRVMKDLSAQLEDEMTPTEVFYACVAHPILKEAVPHMKEKFIAFAKRIVESKDKSSNFLMRLAYEIFAVEKLNKNMSDKIRLLREWVS